MRPKSLAEEQRQLALALELSKRQAAAAAELTKGGGRDSRVGIRTVTLFHFMISRRKLRQQPKSRF